jgi:hypothetical protein
MICVYCNGLGAETRDHLGGRDDTGVPLRPGLWVPAHRGCNAAAFTPWRIAGLARVDGRDRLVIEGRRTIVGLHRIATCRPAVADPGATFFIGSAALLDDLVARVENSS